MFTNIWKKSISNFIFKVIHEMKFQDLSNLKIPSYIKMFKSNDPHWKQNFFSTVFISAWLFLETVFI